MIKNTIKKALMEVLDMKDSRLKIIKDKTMLETEIKLLTKTIQQLQFRSVLSLHSIHLPLTLFFWHHF